MADASHLESMGRELKCPICLSLLDKAASLTCNHVFCCCCIEESMKTAPYCPVCKVPFRRREIRPAPHMDNLVSIYKSMEAASGVNLFVTQVAPPITPSEIKNHSGDDRIWDLQDKGQTSTGGSSAVERKKKNVTRGLIESVPIPVKPSFPAKKRVHVPHCPPSDTRFAKITDEPPSSTNREQKSPNEQIDKSTLGQKEEPLFPPFFWLKDDNSPKTTQESSGDQSFGTPPDVPTFSDIKDSDDEFHSDIPPEIGECTSGGEKVMFESEMFEWTQRACSPELCSSPGQRESGGGSECLRQDADGVASHTETIVMENGPTRSFMINAAEKKDTGFPISCSAKNKTDLKLAGMSRKRSKKPIERKPRKCAKITIDASRVLKELQNLPEEKMHKSGNEEESNAIKKVSERKKSRIDADLTRTTGKLSGSSNGENVLVPDSNKIVIDLPVQKKSGKRSTSRMDTHCDFALEAKKLKGTNKSMDPNQSDILLTHLPGKLICDEVEGSDMGRTLRRCRANPRQKMQNFKMVKFHEENNANYHTTKRKLASEVEISGVGEKNFDGNTGNSSGAEAAPFSSGEKTTDEFLCEFCHTTDHSEVSGVMLHYLKGKPVAGDHTEGPNVIHCHKNCTEWAPNVFYEDDNAINLEAELRRSRKIRCGLCGKKGAALGCFDQSCRKSFHIPCAKMTPQFRWDNENFVVLCPLHASSKLPCEMPAFLSTRKKSSSNRDSHVKNLRMAKDNSKESLQWKSCESPRDFVLCCSGLTDIEKEVVSQFEKLSGIRILKNWDRSVTHVVAATDHNGACKRTLKFLMGILEGKWIVNIEWVRACMKSMKLVAEQPYEIKVDTHGMENGPHLGRLRYLKKKPKLFSGCKFYFIGKILPSYKGYLTDLVIAAGGSVLKRKPVPKDQDLFSSSTSTVFIVYNVDQPEQEKSESRSNRSSALKHNIPLDAMTLANLSGGVAVTNSWLLNSIAGCTVQKLPE